MSIIGISPIVLQPASQVWPGEIPPPADLAELFDALPALFEREDLAKIKDKLERITLWDTQPGNKLHPSQELRRMYWSGRFMARSSDLKQAAAFFEKGLALVDRSQDQDFDSKIELALYLANTLHDNLQTRESLAFYELMLELWHEKIPDPETRRLDTEIQILNYIGRQYWSLAEFDRAHGIFARTIIAADGAGKKQRTKALNKEHANGLWMLGLTLRAQSDQRDGDVDYLNTALNRMRRARGLYKSVGIHDNILARFDVQIAEVYFDLAELHQIAKVKESARSMLNAGLPLAEEALQYIKNADDAAGFLLAEITRLRFDIMQTHSRAPSQPIEEKLSEIERHGAEINDRFVLAKAATLRAEWLIKLGEITKACDSLQWAIEGFGADGKGMATRAERLYRAHCSNLSGPEIPFGGYEKSRN